MTYSDEEHFSESAKMIHDYLKHLTTLSTGSLLLIVTFIEKLFQQPEWSALVGVSITSFLVSIICSVVAMAVFINVMSVGEIEGPSKSLAQISLVGTWAGFAIGVIGLALFALKNLY